MATYNVMLIGSPMCGKTTFINRHITGEFNNKSNRLINNLKFNTSKGEITFNVEELNILDSFSKPYDAAIVMFSVASVTSYDMAGNIATAIRKNSNIPIVFCGNKTDRSDHSVKSGNVTLHKKYTNSVYYNISNKINYNLYQPFLSLCRTLSNDPELHFIDKL